MLRYVIGVYKTINNITVIAKAIITSYGYWLTSSIPNRVVKPACADGTAVMWESMSFL
jgi:hypothetical protein